MNSKTQALIDNNESQYGTEIRAKYGDDVVDKSNKKIKGMSEEQYAESERIRLEFEETLKVAFADGNPSK